MTDTKTANVIGIAGTRLTLNGEPFPFTGLSFFNALYNPNFNRDPGERLRWLRLFKENGVNALRVWCQWNFAPPRVFIDVTPETTMYTECGEIRSDHFATLAALILAADSLDMVIELTLFSHEKEPNLPVDVQERAAGGIARLLIPYRNVIVQIWNEKATEDLRYYAAVKAADSARLVTSSPGVSDVLGDERQNGTFDLLTPHTVRRSADEPFWEVAPRQVASLIEQYGKPVIDDEPARSGPVQFGGLEGGTQPEQHIAQIQRVRALGGYPIYHHDMFQYGYDAPTTPPSGIPEPDFSPFHRRVFDYLRESRAQG